MATPTARDMTIHKATAARYTNTPCDLDYDADWPYECVARDEHPDHRVIVCRTHLVWWHEARELMEGAEDGC